MDVPKVDLKYQPMGHSRNKTRLDIIKCPGRENDPVFRYNHEVNKPRTNSLVPFGS